MTTEECLAEAWTFLAPQRTKQPELPFGGFVRGFWPDMARVAIAMFEQQTKHPTLDFRPTRCEFGDAPEIRRVSKSRSGIDLGKLEIKI
jgi:hypothetical protein